MRKRSRPFKYNENDTFTNRVLAPMLRRRNIDWISLWEG